MQRFARCTPIQANGRDGQFSMWRVQETFPVTEASRNMPPKSGVQSRVPWISQATDQGEVPGCSHFHRRHPGLEYLTRTALPMAASPNVGRIEARRAF
jgi:hypothetical protein